MFFQIQTDNNNSLNLKKQYIENLNFFINIFNNDYHFIEKQKMMIFESLLLTNNHHFFYHNHTFNTKLFTTKIKIYIITNFFTNFKLIASNSKLINDFFNSHSINIILSIDDIEVVDKLYELLKKLCFSSVNNWNIIYLFDEIISYNENICYLNGFDFKDSFEESKKHFIIQWESIIKNYLSDKNPLI